jgi:hypothetical protein
MQNFIFTHHLALGGNHQEPKNKTKNKKCVQLSLRRRLAAAGSGMERRKPSKYYSCSPCDAVSSMSKSHKAGLTRGFRSRLGAFTSFEFGFPKMVPT